MRLKPFRIEQYYAKYEFATRYMLSSSDCESRTIGEVLALEPGAQERLLEQWCGYTESPGALYLREAVAAGYDTLAPDDVVIASNAEEAIFTLYHALLAPGDHAIVETPCYESALEVARSTGSDVSTWVRRSEDGWAHDLDALAGLVRPDTRLLYINTPHNPTGTHMTRSVFDRVVELARAHDLILFCDEVYRELEHDPQDRLPAVCDVYERGVSLGSISKSYGLPGLRIGWLASRERGLLQAVVDLKHYTTICSSAPSEFLTALAVRNRETLIERNRAIIRRNLPLLDDFLARRSGLFEWVRPAAGPIGFPQVVPDVDVTALCEEIAAASSVLLLPGAVYDEPRHVRVGFGRANMPEALERLDAHLDQKFVSAAHGR
jgi:aspartate/methionine/tyrosine aminotransferase